MIPSRRDYALSTDQPILQRNRRRRKPRPSDRPRTEADFWVHFDLEKFARDWRRGVGKRRTPAV